MSHPAARSSLLSRLFCSTLGRLIAFRRDRRSMSELMNLSDEMLRDIGLTRFDIVNARRTAGYTGAGCASLAKEVRDRNSGSAKKQCAANRNIVPTEAALQAA